MIIEIDDIQLEYILKRKFGNDIQKIKNFIKDIILEEIENEKFLSILKSSHKQDFVEKDEVFKYLD